jgi:hypothetical protein
VHVVGELPIARAISRTPSGPSVPCSANQVNKSSARPTGSRPLLAAIDRLPSVPPRAVVPAAAR